MFSIPSFAKFTMWIILSIFSQALLTHPLHNKRIYANGEGGGIWQTFANEASTTNYASPLQYRPVSRKRLVIFIIQGITDIIPYRAFLNAIQSRQHRSWYLPGSTVVLTVQLNIWHPFPNMVNHIRQLQCVCQGF